MPEMLFFATNKSIHSASNCIDAAAAFSSVESPQSFIESRLAFEIDGKQTKQKNK
jgi:hypothetical protein